MVDLAGGSPLSLSVGPTPIPSPQPSHTSSQKSYRSNSPSKRRRNHSSGHVSSSSEETIRAHDFHSTTSLVSRSSSFGHGGGAIRNKVSRAEVRDRLVLWFDSYGTVRLAKFCCVSIHIIYCFIVTNGYIITHQDSIKTLTMVHFSLR